MKRRPYDNELKEALAAGRERRYQDAARLLSALLRKSDDYPEAVLYLGRSYHALGELPRAIALYTFFLRLVPGSAAGHFFLGRSYLALGQPRMALGPLKRCTDIRADFVPGLTLAGIAYLRSRRPDQAVRYLQRAVEAQPSNPRIFTAYLNALLTQAIKLFREGDLIQSGQMLQFILRHHEESVPAHVYLGRIFRDLGKPVPALEHFDAASRLEPEDPALKLQKATIHLQTGQPERALEELRGATAGLDAKAFLTQDPTELARLLTISYFQNGRYREAISHGTQVLRESPGEPQIHVLIAEAFRNLGELRKARNHYERALESDKRNPDVMFGYAMVVLEQGDYPGLRSILSRIEKTRPNDPTAAYYLAICESRLGEDPAQSIELLQRQIRSRGADPFLMLALAKDYLRAGLPELAEGWFRRTLRLRADDKEALLGLLETSTALGRRDGQIESYRAYLKLYPQEHALRKEFIKLLAQRQEYAEALEHLERLIPHEPNNRTLRELLATCYRRTERYGDAVLLLKELLIADPSSEENLKALVYCLDRAGDRPLATLLLERALRSFPQSIGLRLILGVLLVKSQSWERASAVFRDVVSRSPQEWVAYENLGHIHKRMGDPVFAEKFYARARSARKKQESARKVQGSTPAQ